MEDFSNHYDELELLPVYSQLALDELSEYHTLIEAKLLENAHAYHEQPEETKRQTPYPFFHAKKLLLSFPLFLCYSIILLLFSIFENYLSELCDLLLAKRNLQRKLSDIEEGNTVSRIRQYLYEEVGVRIRNEQLWRKMEDLARVRNRMGHSLGKAHSSLQRAQLGQIAKRVDGVSFLPFDPPQLYISPEHCSQAIKDVSQLFSEIFDATGVG